MKGKLLRRTTVLCVAMLASLLLPATGMGDGVTITKDLTYGEADGVALKLDAYVPVGKGPFPAVLLFHGGAWTAGSRTGLGLLAQQLAMDGLAAFPVDYRLAPQFPYPAAIDDAQAAVRWIRDHASQFQVDPTRIGAAGGSAGGHIAAMLGALGDGPLDRGSRIKVVVSWSGPMDLDRLLNGPDPMPSNFVKVFLGCRGGPACDDVAKVASPTSYVDPTDAAMFLANSASEEVPLDQAIEMEQLLKEQGIPHELVDIPGSLHSKLYFDTKVTVNGSTQTVLETSIAYFKKWLNKKWAVANVGPSPSSSPTGATSSTQAPESMTPPASAGNGRPRAAASRRSSSFVAMLAVLAVLGLVAATAVWAVRRHPGAPARPDPRPSPDHAPAEAEEESAEGDTVGRSLTGR
jgi:acetyl esterase/lipase